MGTRSVVGIACAVMAIAGGCAAHPRDAGFQDVRNAAEPRTGSRLEWRQDAGHDQVAAERIRAMLREPLSVEAATQIALLNNPSLQAEFEEVGIAQADMVQAGLLANPKLFGRARFPDRPPSATDTEFSIAQNFLDLFLLAARKKLAAAQLRQTQLRVSHAVVVLAGQVQSAYYSLQGAQQSQALRQQETLAAKAAADTAGRRHEAGHADDLDLRVEQAAYQRARLEALQGESQVVAAREALRVLLGIPAEQTGWSIVEDLPELPATDPPREDLEAMALAQRLDLAAARTDVIGPSLALSRGGLLGSVDVGVDTERATDGQNVTGPQVELELPIFDQHQAAIAKIEAQLRQSRRQVESLEADIRSQVRKACSRLATARQTASLYRDSLLPLQEQIVTLSQRQYDSTATGADTLREARRDERDARRAYVEALRDYWIARVDLAQAVGGRLPSPEAAPTTRAAATLPAPDTQPASMPVHEQNDQSGR